MAVSARRGRTPDRKPAFDLRVTTLAFVLAAVVLLGVWFTGRVVLEAAGRHPVAAVAVCLISAPAAVAGLRGGRRFRAARAARRAATVLTEAAEDALDTLEEVPGGPGNSERPGSPEPVEYAEPADGAEAARYAEPGGAAAAAVPPGRPGRPDYEAMEAEEFEQAVAALCERDGCQDVEAVGGAGDLGADVVATSPDGRHVVIQCKRYSDTNKVGSQDVQRFGGTCFTVHQAQVAAVVTTGDFTAPAAEYAQRCGILCFDRHALAAWSDGTGPAPWEGTGEPPAGPGTYGGVRGGMHTNPHGGLYHEGAARAGDPDGTA
ncbi:restriction endonuclease [Streptomyces sp. CNQ085]|uniref:restriction endonuclease n=1 Tax=Streptomyces sp. CNQ085 TaxID=2886944 RepID=UPI001F505D4A|nr:restriction endonuclease [Streptomyces sp. CNQ085]MCI0386326.1 restriction endonuclease [Streptomyces sp. CNQ085]